jgi:hypothetical protein
MITSVVIFFSLFFLPFLSEQNNYYLLGMMRMSRFVRKYESIVIYNIQKNKITIVLIIDAREGLFRKVQSAGKTAQQSVAYPHT